MLPSYDPPPSLPSSSIALMNGAAGYSTPTPPVRMMRRLVLPLGQQQTHDWHSHPHGVVGTHSRSHSRQGSQSSLLTASNSPSLGGAAAPPTGSSTLVDRDVIGAIQAAVEAAPEIWEMMDEMEEEGDTDSRARDEFREVLSRAKDVTVRLRGSIAAMQEGAPPQAVDGKALHDDAHLFVKVSLCPSIRLVFTGLQRRAILGSPAEWHLAPLHQGLTIHAWLPLL